MCLQLGAELHRVQNSRPAAFWTGKNAPGGRAPRSKQGSLERELFRWPGRARPDALFRPSEAAPTFLGRRRTSWLPARPSLPLHFWSGKGGEREE